jgi:hypothetical protein
MKQTVYTIKIRVYTQELETFFKGNPDYGSFDKPYPADNFYELISPYALFYGPLKNILLFQSKSKYIWTIENANGTPLVFSGGNDNPELTAEMITKTPSDTKWKKLFKNAPSMQNDGKIKLKSSQPNENKFELETESDVAGAGNVKYSFIFEFKDQNGQVKYGAIDPISNPYPPPPPPDGDDGN